MVFIALELQLGAFYQPAGWFSSFLVNETNEHGYKCVTFQSMKQISMVAIYFM